MSAYRDLALPATEALTSRVLCLPTGTAVSIDVVQAICDVIAFAVRHGADLASLASDDQSLRALR